MKKIVPNNAVLIPDQANCVFRGKIFDVYQWQQQMFDDSKSVFEMLKRPDTVTVIGIVDKKILVIEDEQPHNGMRQSFPGGRVDVDDDSTLTAAKREMKEETGYEFNNWRLVQVMQPHTKLEWFIYFYVAWDGSKTAKSHLDSGEKINIKLCSFDELKKLVLDKAGYLGESKELIEPLSSIEEVLSLQEYQGSELNR